MNKGFSSTLKKLRKGKRLTLEQLANDINQKYDVNFNKGMLSKWENNQLPVSNLLERHYHYKKYI